MPSLMLSSTVCSTSRALDVGTRRRGIGARPFSRVARGLGGLLGGGSRVLAPLQLGDEELCCLRHLGDFVLPAIEIAADRPWTCAAMYCCRTWRRVITARRTYTKMQRLRRHRSDVVRLSRVNDETVSLKYADRVPMSRWVALEIAETDATNSALVW